MAPGAQLIAQAPHPRGVHRRGDSGSPRLWVSTNRSRSARSVGSAVVTGVRPAPGRRTRPGSSRSPVSSSRQPRRIVFSAIPVARAAAAAHNRPAFIQLTRQSPIALADRGLIDHPCRVQQISTQCLYLFTHLTQMNVNGEDRSTLRSHIRTMRVSA